MCRVHHLSQPGMYSSAAYLERKDTGPVLQRSAMVEGLEYS